MERVAIYGGTFDPVHNGHLEVARGVLKLFALDQVSFVPACVPPHKRNVNITSPFHRFAMLALATEADRRLLVSTIELDAPDRPYAVDTVARMLNADRQLFFLMGADSWGEITTWHEWQQLLKMCHVIIVTRPDYEITGYDNQAVVDLRGKECERVRAIVESQSEPRVFVTDVAMAAISATAVRQAARADQTVELEKIVPRAVIEYIDKHGLYKN